MHPFRFNRIQPRTLAGEATNNEPTTTLPFDASIVCLDPFTHDLTLVPRSIVPNQEQGTLTLSRKVGHEPRQESARDNTDWATHHKAHEHLRQGWNVKSIAGNRFGFLIRFRNFLFDQAERLVFSPCMERRLFLATPPGFIGETKGYVRIRLS